MEERYELLTNSFSAIRIYPYPQCGKGHQCDTMTPVWRSLNVPPTVCRNHMQRKNPRFFAPRPSLLTLFSRKIPHMRYTEILLVIFSALLFKAPLHTTGIPTVCYLPASTAVSAGLATGRTQSRQVRLSIDCSTFRYRRGENPRRNIYSIRSLTDPKSPFLRQSKEEMELDLEDHYAEIRKLHDRFLATRDRLEGGPSRSLRLSKKKKIKKSNKSASDTKGHPDLPDISEAELLQLVSALNVNHQAWGIPKWEYYLLVTELMDFATISNFFQDDVILTEFTIDKQFYEAIHALTAFGCLDNDCPGVIARTFRSWYHFYGDKQRPLISTALKNIISMVSDQDPENAARIVHAFTQLEANTVPDAGQYFRMMIDYQTQELVEMSLNAITLLIREWDYLGRTQASFSIHKELKSKGIYLRYRRWCHLAMISNLLDRWGMVEKEWKLTWTYPSPNPQLPALHIPATCITYDLENKREKTCTIPLLMDTELAENWTEYLEKRAEGHWPDASRDESDNGGNGNEQQDRGETQ